VVGSACRIGIDEVASSVVRLVAAFVIRFVAAFVALAVVGVVVDGVSVDPIGLPIAALIYALIMLIAEPALERLLAEGSGWVARLTGLAATFVALLVTTLISDSLEVDGVVAWVLATVIVWVVAVAADWIVGRLLFERIAGSPRKRSG
jgi:uncharacterized membrane protein YvlD (DUF360 family)